MKHFFLSLSLGMAALAGSAQFGTAPDFNVTDLDGNTHQLYADILDQGLIAVIDVSATWCGPCWNLHNSHALQELHEAYGPDGTNQLRVMFYEGDGSTTLDDIMGTGSATLGDWTDGVTYPIVNESPLSLDMNIWAPLGFPTVNVIRPSDYEIVLDTYNLYSLEEQVDAINGADIDGIVLGVANTGDLAAGRGDIDVYPNPTNGEFAVALNGFHGTTELEVYNIVGNLVWSTQLQGATAVQNVDLGELEAGNYLLRVSNEGNKVTRRVTLLD